jgi:tellurite resistance protein
MLLDQLTFEEKNAFWNIANLLAFSDGKVLEEESILEQYNEEMGTGFAYPDASAIDLTKELEILKASSIKNRKIVYFELFGVAYADTEFNDREKDLLDKICLELSISDAVRETLETSVKTIFDTYRKLGDVFNS